jgi:uncharacterized delta-60 repeat protein
MRNILPHHACLALSTSLFLAACGGGGGGSGASAPASGSLDTSFGTSGRVATSIGLGANAGGQVLVQPDGKIVLAGNCVNATLHDFCAARYNADGSLDSSFGAGGKAMMPGPAGSDVVVFAATLQTDGKIVLAGSCSLTGIPQVCAARFNANGTADSGFAGSGALRIDTGGAHQGQAMTVVVQSDGGILLGGECAGTTTSQLCMVRLLSNGGVDAGFGAGGTGIVLTSYAASSLYNSALVLQSDGKPVWGGYRYSGTTNRFYAERYTVGGILDTSYGSSGVVETQVLTGQSTPKAAAMLSGNKLVMVGICNDNPLVTNYLCAVRYNADGSIDNTFGALGKVAIDPGSFEANALAVQADGKLLVGGREMVAGGNEFALLRLNADGALDTTFGSNGKTVLATTNDTLQSVAVQSDGKIVAGGNCIPSGGTRQLCAARLHP